LALAFSLSAAACSFDGGVSHSPGNGAPGQADGGGDVDAAPAEDAAEIQNVHLLLSEVKNTITGTEFIEIYNPGSTDVPLGDYYLADNAAYASLPIAHGDGTMPGVINSDFIARFPAGATIAPGEALVVGVNATSFQLIYGIDPDFHIGSGGGIEMREAFEGSVGSLSSLTDSGEGIALFYWDGETDLVTDVDLLIAGATTTDSNALANKTSLAVDGPDSGSTPTVYKADLGTMGGTTRGTVFAESFVRISLEEGAETHESTGNGRHGHDESTEDTASTWSIVVDATPGVVSVTL
jgi:hypothetical protein